MSRRQNRRPKKTAQHSRGRYLPSVDGMSNMRSNESRMFSDHNLTTNGEKKVKIRVQGRPGDVTWGSLSRGVNNTRPLNNSCKSIFWINSYIVNVIKNSNREVSVKDAERHAKILSKIEKYREDKLIRELEMIEQEKIRANRLIKAKRRKEVKRKQYLEEQRIKYVPLSSD